MYYSKIIFQYECLRIFSELENTIFLNWYQTMLKRKLCHHKVMCDLASLVSLSRISCSSFLYYTFQTHRTCLFHQYALLASTSEFNIFCSLKLECFSSYSLSSKNDRSFRSEILYNLLRKVKSPGLGKPHNIAPQYLYFCS